MVVLPSRLKGRFFDSLWETSRIWALPTPAVQVPLDELSFPLEMFQNGPRWTIIDGSAAFRAPGGL